MSIQEGPQKSTIINPPPERNMTTNAAQDKQSSSSVTTASTITSSSNVATANSSTTEVATTEPATGTNARAMTCRQLQEELNYFMMELQKQEELFFDQVKKANDQAKVLTLASEKVSKLQSTTLKLKSDHERINQALEYVKDQQTEMEKILSDLERAIPDFVPDVDPRRQELYASAIDINNQLGQMGQDLRFVIEHINETNHSAESADNPICRILKIMNEHTDILTWVDQSCDKLRKSLNDVRNDHKEVVKLRSSELRQLRH